MMYDRFGYPGLFAAYNAGPARYAAHLASRRPLPLETRRYLLRAADPNQQQRAGLALFTQRPSNAGKPDTHPADASPLFFRLGRR